jgi:integrase
MEVSKRRARTFTLTLGTYGEYIPEQDGEAANTLRKSPALVRVDVSSSNVAPLFGG